MGKGEQGEKMSSYAEVILKARELLKANRLSAAAVVDAEGYQSRRYVACNLKHTGIPLVALIDMINAGKKMYPVTKGVGHLQLHHSALRYPTSGGTIEEGFLLVIVVHNG